jgi:hypothetical protein
METPISNNVVLIDCTEDSLVTIAGEGTRLARFYRNNNGSVSGTTTDNTATKAWSIQLAPGQLVILEAQCLGRARNAAERRAAMARAFAYRAGSSLAYDTQTGNFTTGRTLTGASSGATAIIQADSDSGATGTLTLVDIVGTFVDNEIITDGAGGSALVNGVISHANAALDGSGSNVELAGGTNMSDFGTTAFVANGPEIEFRVTGASNRTIDWDVNVRVHSN